MLITSASVRLSYQQAIAAGRNYAMVPVELVPEDDAQMVAAELGLCGAGHGGYECDWPVLWVCLLPTGHRWRRGTVDCGWPATLTERQAAVDAFVEQTDPVRRVERRAAFELARVGAVDRDYAAGMLRAGALDDLDELEPTPDATLLADWSTDAG